MTWDAGLKKTVEILHWASTSCYLSSFCWEQFSRADFGGKHCFEFACPTDWKPFLSLKECLQIQLTRNLEPHIVKCHNTSYLSTLNTILPPDRLQYRWLPAHLLIQWITVMTLIYNGAPPQSQADSFTSAQYPRQCTALNKWKLPIWKHTKLSRFFGLKYEMDRFVCALACVGERNKIWQVF